MKRRSYRWEAQNVVWSEGTPQSNTDRTQWATKHLISLQIFIISGFLNWIYSAGENKCILRHAAVFNSNQIRSKHTHTKEIRMTWGKSETSYSVSDSFKHPFRYLKVFLNKRKGRHYLKCVIKLEFIAFKRRRRSFSEWISLCSVGTTWEW